MNEYIIKLGEEKNQILSHHCGYVMLPSEVYLFDESTVIKIVKKINDSGFYAKAIIKPDEIKSTIEFKEDADVFAAEIINVLESNKQQDEAISKLMKDKKAVHLWLEHNAAMREWKEAEGKVEEAKRLVEEKWKKRKSTEMIAADYSEAKFGHRFSLSACREFQKIYGTWCDPK